MIASALAAFVVVTALAIAMIFDHAYIPLFPGRAITGWFSA